MVVPAVTGPPGGATMAWPRCHACHHRGFELDARFPARAISACWPPSRRSSSQGRCSRRSPRWPRNRVRIRPPRRRRPTRRPRRRLIRRQPTRPPRPSRQPTAKPTEAPPVRAGAVSDARARPRAPAADPSPSADAEPTDAPAARRVPVAVDRAGGQRRLRGDVRARDERLGTSPDPRRRRRAGRRQRRPAADRRDPRAGRLAASWPSCAPATTSSMSSATASARPRPPRTIPDTTASGRCVGSAGTTSTAAVNPKGSAIVAVLDTGVDAAHADLAGRLVAGTSLLPGSDADERSERPRHRHGRNHRGRHRQRLRHRRHRVRRREGHAGHRARRRRPRPGQRHHRGHRLGRGPRRRRHQPLVQQPGLQLRAPGRRRLRVGPRRRRRRGDRQRRVRRPDLPGRRPRRRRRLEHEPRRRAERVVEPRRRHVPGRARAPTSTRSRRGGGTTTVTGTSASSAEVAGGGRPPARDRPRRLERRRSWAAWRAPRPTSAPASETGNGRLDLARAVADRGDGCREAGRCRADGRWRTVRRAVRGGRRDGPDAATTLERVDRPSPCSPARRSRCRWSCRRPAPARRTTGTRRAGRSQRRRRWPSR